MPRPSDQRIGVRVVDGEAEILVGLCDGEQIESLRVEGPGDEAAGEEEFVDWWVIERLDPHAGGSTEGQREQVITVGEVPDGFEETVPLRGPVPVPPPVVGGSVRMQSGSNAGFFFEEEAFDTDGRWVDQEGGDLLTTEQLLAQRTSVCPETYGE